MRVARRAAWGQHDCVLNYVLLVLVIALGAYLLYSLLRPEDF